MTSKFARKLQTIRSQSLASVVYHQIQEMILSNKILPGEHINENHLSQVLRVSRAPIREACRQLEKDGLVEFRVKQGPFVRDVEIEEVLELYDIRTVLEALAAEKAAERAQDKDFDELEKLIQDMSKHLSFQDMEAYLKSSIDYHYAILRMSGNDSLMSIMETISKKFYLFRKRIIIQRRNLKVIFNQKVKIFEALKARDGKKAANIMRKHVAGGKKRLLNQINK